MLSCNSKNNLSNKKDNSSKIILNCENLKEIDKLNYINNIVGVNKFYTSMFTKENMDSIFFQQIQIHEGDFNIVHFGLFPTPEFTIFEKTESEVLRIDSQYINLKKIIPHEPIAFVANSILLNIKNRKILIMNPQMRYYVNGTETYYYLVFDVTNKGRITYIKTYKYDTSCLEYFKRDNGCFGFYKDNFYFSATSNECNNTYEFINLDSLINVTTPTLLEYY